MIDPADYDTLRPKTGTRWRLAHPRPFDLPNGVIFGLYVREERGRDPLRAIVTIDLLDTTEPGAGHWLHISVSHARRLPTWSELVQARDELGYGSLVFVQLLPPVSAWINVHEYVLHALARLDAPTVPRALWDQHGADGEHYGKRAPLRGRL